MSSTAPSQSDRPSAADVAVRALVATVGAYGVAYVLTSALTGLCGRLGMGRADAIVLASSLGLIVLPTVSIWAFGERRLRRVVAWPTASIVLLAAATWAMRP
jgi:hypothetical protein